MALLLLVCGGILAVVSWSFLGAEVVVVVDVPVVGCVKGCGGCVRGCVGGRLRVALLALLLLTDVEGIDWSDPLRRALALVLVLALMLVPALCPLGFVFVVMVVVVVVEWVDRWAEAARTGNAPDREGVMLLRVPIDVILVLDAVAVLDVAAAVGFDDIVPNPRPNPVVPIPFATPLPTPLPTPVVPVPVVPVPVPSHVPVFCTG